VNKPALNKATPERGCWPLSAWSAQKVDSLSRPRPPGRPLPGVAAAACLGAVAPRHRGLDHFTFRRRRGPGRVEQRASQPVRLLATRGADGAPHRPRFVRSQPHREDFPQGVFLRHSWPAHFRCHRQNQVVYKKCLTGIYFSFTRSPVSILGRHLAGKNARTSLARLAGQRHPASTGAGNERLAVSARSIKVEATGDFWRGDIKPKIRLSGHWLERAGFKPGHRVEVRSDQPGTLTLCFLEQAPADTH
jgi:hypothetical protein